MKKIKVAYVAYSFEVGGMETLLLELLNGLDKNQYEVHLITLTNDKLKLVSSLDKNVFVYSLGFDSKQVRSLYGFFSGLKKLKEMFQSIKPDIVHSNLYFIPLLLTSLAIKVARINCLHLRTVHTSGLFYENQKSLLNKFRLFIEKVAIKINKTYLISVSKAVHQNNRKYFKNLAEDIRLIYNGIDLKKYDKKKFAHIRKNDFDLFSEDLVISYVARLDNGKNHDFLIDIWSEVKKEIPNAVLCFAGDGVLKDQIVRKIEFLHAQESIKLLGSISNVAELLSISDLAVFPTSFEGFSLVLLEKFAMGLPVVASDIKPFQEIATNDESAFLVSLDDKQRYIDCIVLLAKDSSLRETMGRNACLVAHKFSIENTIKLHQDYYLECIDSLL